MIARKRGEEEENIGTTEVQLPPATETQRLDGRIEREGSIKGIVGQSLQVRMMELCEEEGIINMTECNHKHKDS